MRAVTVGVPPVAASVPGVGWPTLPIGRAATLANLLHELDRTQWVPPERVLAAQYHQLRVIARALAPTVPAFRARARPRRTHTGRPRHAGRSAPAPPAHP